MGKELVYNFKINSVMDVAQVISGVQQIQAQLNGLQVPAKLGNNIGNTIKNLNSELSNYENLTASVITSEKEFKAVDDSLNTILRDWQKLTGLLEQVEGIKVEDLIPQNTVKKINESKKALETYDKELLQIQKDSKRTRDELDKAQTKLKEAENKRSELTEQNKKIGSRKGVLGKQLYGAGGKAKELEELRDKIKDSGGTLKDNSDYDKLAGEVKNLRQEYDSLSRDISKNKDAQVKLDGTITNARKKIAELNQELENFQAQGNAQAFENLRQSIADIQFNGDISKVPQDLQEIKNLVNQMTPEALQQIQQTLTQMKSGADNAAEGTKNLSNGFKEVNDQRDGLKKTAQEVERLSQQVEYFFGLQNIIYLFKDAVRQAFETVKELDEAMTETAVVTDFSVGDMWEALPKYTAAANELGTTTLGAYETMTLYYQQGGLKI